ncbi:hypothetical protein ES288_D11G368100v1 [Gossypium darwinii]|uniref:Uncharacterized protein n=1 Tax=Gossypium darwinii TaxID=34276 RepID=A0A5D2AS76_GOSDA|nr:hypothetical protein ES288_D11G368100v1 [Gossypium darwinii]
MSLTSDVKGLLELYEASHLRVHGEDILEEALGFTTTHLGLAKAAGTIEYPLSALVSHALYQPIRKGLPRLEARRFISIYRDDASHNKTLLKFAELDFNLWGKSLDLPTKLPFVRDRLPQYSFAREILAKTMVMTSIMDDIYDAYGTLEELQLLSNAIQRLATSHDSILNLKVDSVSSCNDYNENFVPRMEEYMRNAVLSVGYIMLTVTSFIEIFDWASKNPKITDASSVVDRLMNDVTSHKSLLCISFECYMREHAVSEEACTELKKQVENAWKDINQEIIFSEISKVVPRIGDEYTHVGKNTKDGITLCSLIQSQSPIEELRLYII